jgi:hypothetical protein
LGRTGSLILAYYSSTIFVIWVVGAVLVFDVDPHPVFTWWIIAIPILISVGMFFAIFWKGPKFVKDVLIIMFIGWLLWSGSNTLFIKQRFDFSAPQFWMLAVGGLMFFEMNGRSWKPQIGNWPSSIATYMTILTVFATAYYPHIKASYGGGTAIPIEITFTKDFPPMPNQTIACTLIDETDSGFYVIGKDEKHATFIPRSAVTLIHFADASEPSIFTPKSK